MNSPEQQTCLAHSLTALIVFCTRQSRRRGFRTSCSFRVPHKSTTGGKEETKKPKENNTKTINRSSRGGGILCSG